jgi:hypothetical protein
MDCSAPAVVAIIAACAAPVAPGVKVTATTSYFCDFEDTLCDFGEQSKLEGTGEHRFSFVTPALSGRRAVRLPTLPGDSNVHGSGSWERTDLSKPAAPDYCNAGQEEWWAFSVLFPDDYVFPPGPEAGIIMDFHHTGSGGQANWELQTIPGIGLRARGYGGASRDQGKYDAAIPDPYGTVAGVTKNKWYNFTVHVKWSPDAREGFMEGWLNGRRFQNYRGATLYAGQSCYFKLANYHAPFGKPSAIHYDRILRGRSGADVSLVPLAD